MPGRVKGTLDVQESGGAYFILGECIFDERNQGMSRCFGRAVSSETMLTSTDPIIYTIESEQPAQNYLLETFCQIGYLTKRSKAFQGGVVAFIGFAND